MIMIISMAGQNAITNRTVEMNLNYPTRSKLRELILKINPEADIYFFPTDAHVKNDLGLNSIEIMELIASIEDVFDVEVDDRAVRFLQQVDQIINMLEVNIPRR